MTWEELQKFIKGKRFLIGLTFIDADGKVIEQYQTNGIVDQLSDNGVFDIVRNNGSLFQIPYDKDAIRKAEKGEYREKATGQIITNPDFILTWEIVTEETDDLDEIKKHGYR